MSLCRGPQIEHYRRDTALLAELTRRYEAERTRPEREAYRYRDRILWYAGIPLPFLPPCGRMNKESVCTASYAPSSIACAYVKYAHPPSVLPRGQGPPHGPTIVSVPQQFLDQLMHAIQSLRQTCEADGWVTGATVPVSPGHLQEKDMALDVRLQENGSVGYGIR